LRHENHSNHRTHPAWDRVRYFRFECRSTFHQCGTPVRPAGGFIGATMDAGYVAANVTGALPSVSIR
jgi:hypothetical protein